MRLWLARAFGALGGDGGPAAISKAGWAPVASRLRRCIQPEICPIFSARAMEADEVQRALRSCKAREVLRLVQLHAWEPRLVRTCRTLMMPRPSLPLLQRHFAGAIMRLRIFEPGYCLSFQEVLDSLRLQWDSPRPLRPCALALYSPQAMPSPEQLNTTLLTLEQLRQRCAEGFRRRPSFMPYRDMLLLLICAIRLSRLSRFSSISSISQPTPMSRL